MGRRAKGDLGLSLDVDGKTCKHDSGVETGLPQVRVGTSGSTRRWPVDAAEEQHQTNPRLASGPARRSGEWQGVNGWPRGGGAVLVAVGGALRARPSSEGGRTEENSYRPCPA